MIVRVDNHGSIRLLEKAGFSFERRMRLSPDAAEVSLYASDA
jgi:RimJ/RimL family protein N-acetyltransferase